MSTLLGIMTAGALGALARYWVTVLLARRLKAVTLPVATFLVNITGSLGLGLLVGMVFSRVPAPVRLLEEPGIAILAIGFFGAFTTFSTFSVETVRLWDDYTPRASATYLLLTIGGCLLIWTAGFFAGARLF